MMDHNELILKRAAGVADRKPSAMMPVIWTLVTATIDLQQQRHLACCKVGGIQFNETKNQLGAQQLQ